MKPMGSPRFALAAAVLKGSMVCAGGFDGQRHLASAELYDPRAGRWNSWPRRLVDEAIMQQACISHACLLTKAATVNSCYSACMRCLGIAALGVQPYVCICRWEQVSPMSMPRGSFLASSISEHELLAIAGCTSSDDCTSTCEILDLRMGKWRPTGPLAQPRAFGAAVGTEQVSTCQKNVCALQAGTSASSCMACWHMMLCKRADIVHSILLGGAVLMYGVLLPDLCHRGTSKGYEHLS